MHAYLALSSLLSVSYKPNSLVNKSIYNTLLLEFYICAKLRLTRWYPCPKKKCHYFCTGVYSSIDKMAKYDWNMFRNYVAFLAAEMAPGTRRPHDDSEVTWCYHDTFLPWGHYHNNIVLFYHDSPLTRSHFIGPTDRAIKGLYCNWKICSQWFGLWVWYIEE